MVMKPTNAYKHLRVYYIILYYIILYYISATVMAFLRGLHYKGYIITLFQPMHK